MSIVIHYWVSTPKHSIEWSTRSRHSHCCPAAWSQFATYIGRVFAESRMRQRLGWPGVSRPRSIPVKYGDQWYLGRALYALPENVKCEYKLRSPTMFTLESCTRDFGDPVSNVLQTVDAQGLASLHPVADALPAGFVLSAEGANDIRAITDTFPDPEDAAQRFDEWLFHENDFRSFAAPDGTSAGTTSLDFSLHRFGSDIGASQALPYYAAGRAAIMNLETISAEPIGDQSWAISGPVPWGNEVTLYVRSGPILARITASTLTGDPTPDVMAAAELFVQATSG